MTKTEITARPRRLTPGFAWTLAGNAFYAATQWAVLSLLAKLGSPEMLGQYALAVSIAAPVSMLAHLNLRSVLATDVLQRHPLGDYVTVRLVVAGAGAAAVALFALTVPSATMAVVLTGAAFSIDNISDLYYGALQRRGRLDAVARSMIARGGLSLLAVAAVLWYTGDLVAALAAMTVSRAAVLLLYDRRRGSAGEDLRRTGAPAQRAIFTTAVPLGAVLMLVSLNANIPRYFIEHYFGSAELGAFTAAASFITVGATAVNAFGQAAISPLARRFTSGDIAGFRKLAVRMLALSFALGFAGVAVAVAFGGTVLRVLYRPEIAAYQGLLVAVMAAGTVAYVASTTGYLVTSLRVFAPQLPLFGFAAVICAAASWTLLPAAGLYGAAAAIALSAAVQVAGNGYILARGLRGRPAPAI